MRAFLLLLVCVFASGYALPRYNHIVHFDDDEDVDDDVDVADEPYEEFDGMFTFPTGGPGGPPSNKYLSGNRPVARADSVEVEDDDTEFYTSNFHPYGSYEYVEDGPVVALARGLLRSDKTEKPVSQLLKDEEEDEDEEDDPDDDDDDDDADDDGFSVPDYNKLFPNPDGRPRGPNDYDKYLRHYPTAQNSQSQYQSAPAGQQQQYGSRPAPSQQYGSRPPAQGQYDAPPPQYERSGPPPRHYDQSGPPPSQYERSGPPPRHYDQSGPPPSQYERSGPPPPQYERSGPPPPQYDQSGPPPPQYDQSGPPPSRSRDGPPPPDSRGPPGPPPSRRYRLDIPTDAYSSNEIEDDTAVVVDAYDGPYYRMADEDDSQEDEQEDEEDADDDVDWSVPSYDQLFPTPGNKPPVLGGMRNTWNRPPGPPKSRQLTVRDRDGRFIRLLHSPLHDSYNPEYVIDPQIALDRRNQRMRYRYNNPRWQFLNARTPYNYKPILSQAGHWGNPREHDYNSATGDHYLGGIYNGKTYY